MTPTTAARLRWVLYVAYAVAGPVLIYTQAKGLTGDDEYNLFVALGAALGITAAANTPARIRQRVMGVVKAKPEE